MADSSRDKGADQQGIFKIVARYIPYFRNPQHVLVFKLDCLLLTWTFIAGILKEMDQSATAQAYVSGMKESLQLYGNELVNFNTFFSVGYAIGLIPGQLIQTKVNGIQKSMCSVLISKSRFGLRCFCHFARFRGESWLPGKWIAI